MSKMIFINLPVTDLAASTRFYTALGCVRNPQFSDQNVSSMQWSDMITFQLLARPYFASFSPKPVADPKQTCQALFALNRDSREEVSALADAAAAAGGQADLRAAMDLGWLYNRSFADPDGHVFEAVWVDAKGMPAA